MSAYRSGRGHHRLIPMLISQQPAHTPANSTHLHHGPYAHLTHPIHLLQMCTSAPAVSFTADTRCCDLAGFGAAKHLAAQGLDVTLLNASPNPGGLSAGWRTKQGRAVEAGVKGFWYQYANIFSLVAELGIEWCCLLALQPPFSAYT